MFNGMMKKFNLPKMVEMHEEQKKMQMSVESEGKDVHYKLLDIPNENN